ncbi:molybdate ABC transporter substrate-binding protein [Klenkia taihuensis]|uniref:Molybdate transport system substrate-binding protein n=1 Tax=Klenkia taihuensis TaxID=1225127 RepID=A0A1I1H9F0_9ACTN|nr:molybdate ABC transporter substrate-binding protein [Klenkia taihuensis]GHE09329.1 molybdate-binding protein [Klenkia taihuensis]SFC20212.1 molybdate transport system substrate-binding protein [Klenkia taihuensis]
MRRALPALAVAGLLSLTACGGSASPDAAGTSSSSGSGGELTGTLTVFAAASLTDVFTGLGDQLMAENPDLDITFNFAGSSALATQITQGAPADVFASANQTQMGVVTGAGLAEGDPTVFTENVLEIAVPPDNPADVTGLSDFADADLTLAVCAPDVPCGAAAEQVFEAAGITAQPDTLEEDVRAALTKVELGEVDAALVYASDVQAAGDQVEGIGFPEAEDAVNEYPICTLAGSQNPGAARAFLDLVESEAGQRALTDAGFRSPTS